MIWSGLLSEIQFRFSRGSGPGGQHRNKTSSKATLIWDIRASAAVPADVKSRFVRAFSSRVSTDGLVLISSEEHREQSANREACVDKLLKMLESVRRPPKRRIPTRPSRASVERRITSKKRRSATKGGRGRAGEE